MGIKEIIKQVQAYHPEADTDLICRAFIFARDAHAGQRRVSGEEFIQHPLGVAKILAELQLDVPTIVAGLLHDVVEDTAVTGEDLEKHFGNEVAVLVDGVTKLSRIEYKSKEEQQLENLRKMFLAMARDIRVILIKLADRLHNMRTLKYMPAAKQKYISEETLEIFAPLAHRLGIYQIKWELEDLAFRYLEPEKYYNLVERVAQKRQEREKHINEAIRELAQKLKDMGILAEIQGRPKHFYSIYQKMVKQGKDLSEIYDLSAIRVLVESVKDCYGALGIVHTLWKPIPGRFKDYIAMPKSNMYQSLHTTVVGHHGDPLEIQIRTWEMHRTAEYGIAAHWKYKESGRDDRDFEQKLSWLRQIHEWQQELKDAREFMETLKMDVFSDEVFVFTPKGDVIDLPAGSIPIDFAYRIHTDVGHRCVGAKVNGKMVPLDYRLTNGDIVEIITAKQSAGPSRDWLKLVRSSDARTKIRQFFKKEKREENIVKGRELLEKESRKLGFELHDLTKGERLEEVAKRMNYASGDDLLAAIGYGGLTWQNVLAKLVEAHKKELKTEPADITQILADMKPRRLRSKSGQGILVKGEGDVLVRLSKCCNPVPGDPIVGYITRGRGVSVHRIDCVNALQHEADKDRFIEVAWDDTSDVFYRVAIEISAMDRAGLLSDIMAAIAETRTNVSSVNARATKNRLAVTTIILEISNLGHLENIMQKIRRVKDVFNVQRMLPA